MERIKYHLKFLGLAAGVVLVWKGIWDLADMYLRFHSPVTNALISIAIGVVILLFTDRKLNELL